MTPADFAAAAQQFCALTGGSVTSWGRTEAHNKAVGGVAYSAHRFWLACDVVYDAPRPEVDRAQIAARLGLTLIVEGDHDHLQPKGWGAG